MADDRTYIKLHDGMPDHPKIEGLSDKAFRVLISLWCWCARHRTDGFVPDSTWTRRGTARSRAELLAIGLAVASEGGVRMHDYLEHQRSAAEVAALKERRRAAGSKGGTVKAKRLASARAKSKQTPSKPVADTDTEEVPSGTSQTEAEIKDMATLWPISTTGAGPPAAFEAFWAAWPKKVKRKEAVRAFGKAVDARHPPEFLARQAERWAKLWSAAGVDRQFIPDPTTWLNGERWDDDPPTPRQKAAVNGNGYHPWTNPDPSAYDEDL